MLNDSWKLHTFLLWLLLFTSVCSGIRSDVCELACVKRTYAENCGGAVCVSGFITQQQKQGLCSKQCLSSLGNKEYLECLHEEDANRTDWNWVQIMMLEHILDVCGLDLSALAPEPEIDPAPAPTIAPEPAPEPTPVPAVAPSPAPVEPSVPPAMAPAPENSLEEDIPDYEEPAIAPAPIEMEEGPENPVSFSIDFDSDDTINITIDAFDDQGNSIRILSANDDAGP